uniref:Transmembrane protein n=1 Tax=Rhabditophanes sp. KR3021 TaxID=114890 RepID=A0AC35U3Q6_9BILA
MATQNRIITQTAGDKTLSITIDEEKPLHDNHEMWDEELDDQEENDSFDSWCFVLPCCMDDDESEEFGHQVSVFMVGLVAFATFFCVTLILILVFLLG